MTIAQAPSRRSLLNRRSLVGLGLSAMALLLALRGVHLDAVVASLSHANLMLVAAAAVCSLTTTVLSAQRWRVLLWPHNTPLRLLTGIFFISQLCNAVLPGKLGSPLRALLTSQATAIPLPFALGSVAIERVLDSALMAVLSAVLLIFLPVPQIMQGLGRDVVLLAMGVLGAIILAAFLKPRFAPVVEHAVARLGLPAGLGSVFDALDVLRRRRTYAPLVLLSLLIWVLGAATNGLVLRSLDLAVPWWTALLLLVALQLGGKLPSSPGNIGVFHYVAVLVLTTMGVDASAAFAYAVLLHAVVFILPAIVGAVCLWWLPPNLAVVVSRAQGAAIDKERLASCSEPIVAVMPPRS